MFTGFTDETVDFMWGIRFNNERTWFEAHKEIYLTQLYQPMRELGDELYDHMAPQLKGEPLPDFPRETAIGALALYISDTSIGAFQPMNVNFGIMSPLGYRVKGKANKNLAIAQRSLAIIDAMK